MADFSHLSEEEKKTTRVLIHNPRKPKQNPKETNVWTLEWYQRNGYPYQFYSEIGQLPQIIEVKKKEIVAVVVPEVIVAKKPAESMMSLPDNLGHSTKTAAAVKPLKKRGRPKKGKK